MVIYVQEFFIPALSSVPCRWEEWKVWDVVLRLLIHLHSLCCRIPALCWAMQGTMTPEQCHSPFSRAASAILHSPTLLGNPGQLLGHPPCPASRNLSSTLVLSQFALRKGAENIKCKLKIAIKMKWGKQSEHLKSSTIFNHKWKKMYRVLFDHNLNTA